MAASEVSYDELRAMIDEQRVQLFDVREPGECSQTGVIPGATNIPLGELSAALTSTEPAVFQDKYKVAKPGQHDHNVVMYCRSGNRSNRALQAARAAGYDGVRHFKPGMNGWLEHNKGNK